MRSELRKVAFVISIVFLNGSLCTAVCYCVPVSSSAPVTLRQSRQLNPIHWPDLSKLEPEVREQLANLEKNLTAATKRSDLKDDEMATAFGEAGKLYHAYSFTLTARDCYLNAAMLSPKDFRWPYLLAKIDQQDGRTDEAIRRFTEAGSLNPEYVAAQVNLGNIYLELNQTEKAEANFKKH